MNRCKMLVEENKKMQKKTKYCVALTYNTKDKKCFLKDQKNGDHRGRRAGAKNTISLNMDCLAGKLSCFIPETSWYHDGVQVSFYQYTFQLYQRP